MTSMEPTPTYDYLWKNFPDDETDSTDYIMARDIATSILELQAKKFHESEEPVVFPFKPSSSTMSRRDALNNRLLRLKPHLENAKVHFGVTSGRVCTACQRTILDHESTISDCPWITCSHRNCVDTSNQLWNLYMVDEQAGAINPGESPIISEELWSKYCTERMAEMVADTVSEDDMASLCQEIRSMSGVVDRLLKLSPEEQKADQSSSELLSNIASTAFVHRRS